MHDPTERVRRQLLVEINAAPLPRDHLEARHGRVWSPCQMYQEFEVLAFRAPLVVVRRRSDGLLGSLLFQHEPRQYFSFKPHCR